MNPRKPVSMAATTRRQLLGRGALATILTAACAQGRGAVQRPLTLLLRSGWQIENIGDIAHTPGVLTLLERHLPEARVLYWPMSLNGPIEEMLRNRFPQVEIVQGNWDEKGAPSTEALARAIDQADFLLHGSGPQFVARRDVQTWRTRTGKPFGLYGVTLQDIDAAQRDLLSEAAFVFTRETHSIARLEAAGVRGPAFGFAPDGTFAIDVLDDAKAVPFLEAHGLEEGEYICCVTRLRYTPYHKIRRVGWSEEEIQRKEAHNAQHAEKDHTKMRAAIVRWVRETGKKVLVCPEMTYQLEIFGPLVVDPLPDDVKPFVVARDTYWLPDEAASVYKRAFAVLSMECHSPIIAAAFGTPCFYLRQPEDTIKGQMWYDIGLDDWVFEIDETSAAQIADRLMAVHADYPAARAYLGKAMDFVAARHRETMAACNPPRG